MQTNTQREVGAGKLTKAQREFLERAERNPDADPHVGGRSWRTAKWLESRGLIETKVTAVLGSYVSTTRITPAGRAALAKAVQS